ncbi:DUF4209 domain-containing protein [Myroides odoratimimus]|uniref:DUF4209 domain-containing protein n=1 Tax=Myroides odoratimimus TaxID=76832 RepID=UPI002574F80E|nr:DUF4209 domain-containing protein [Myroides odoratimimus]MDM1448153.1 DUF4209 domain-containing protein [Myroides odoratimimus]
MDLKDIYLKIDNDLFFGAENNFSILNHIGVQKEQENDLLVKSKYVIEARVLFFEFILQNKNFKEESTCRDLHLNDNLLLYIKERIENTSNQLYKFKYSYLYFLFNTSERELLNSGIDAYYKHIRSIEENPELITQISEYKIANTFLGLLYISNKYNYLKKESISIISNNLKILNIKSALIITNYICEHLPKLSTEKKVMYNICHEMYTNLNSEIIEFRRHVYYLNKLDNIYKKTENQLNKKYNNSLGQLYLQHATTLTTGIQIHHFLEESMKFFNNAKNEDMKNKVLKLIQDNKPNIKLGLISYKEDMSEFLVNYMRKIFNIIDLTLEGGSYETYAFLQEENQFLFIFSDEKTNKSPDSIFSILKKSKLDINYNTSNRFNDINYDIYLFQNFSYKYLIHTFHHGILKNILTAENYISYLQENCWFANTGLLQSSEKFKINWIELLTPSIELFFETLKKEIAQTNDKTNNHILVIDSLSLKFEGILRDFIKINGGHSLNVDSKGIITENIKIENMLNNKHVSDIINSKDLLLFEYVFTKKGLDIRNNVAHCFYSASNYPVVYSILLLVCLLRIGNYEIIIKE